MGVGGKKGPGEVAIRDPGEPIREVGRRWEREEVRFIEANRAKVFTGVVRGMHSFRNMERRRKVEM